MSSDEVRTSIRFTEWLELKTERDRLRAELDAARAAIRDLFDKSDWPWNFAIDGFDFQDWAEQHKFLLPETRTTFCREDCHCAEYNGDNPGEFVCLRRVEWLRNDAARSGGEKP